jgi:cell wall-associated NlpC family hydrolase
MKQLLTILFLSSTLSYANISLNSELRRDSIITYAQTFIKTPYLWGGTSPSGFDCTGFLYYVYKKFGIKVSRASSGYQSFGKKLDLHDVQPADILLFTGTDPSKRKVGHVGIVLKNDNGIVEFIHSSSSKKHFGVTITKYNESGYVKRFLRAITIF